MFGSASVYEGGLESEREKLAGGRGSDGGSLGMGARIKLARGLENEAADAMDWSEGYGEGAHDFGTALRRSFLHL